jgi:dTDP-4-amino-4,6-dideoxygalactose transaminase
VAGIKEGDEAITSPITFMASSNSILYCGGKPIFIDIEPDTGNINPEKIRQYLETLDLGLRTQPKAVIPVHYSGHPCNMEAIHEIAKENNLVVIEDAAHALGAKYKLQSQPKPSWITIGSCQYSDMATFSFHPVKSITTGEGGAITTNNKEYYEKLLMLRQHGITKAPKKFLNPYHLSHNPGSWYHEMQLLGFNYRITDFQSALGISQLKKLNGFIERRREIAGIYDDAFKDKEFFDLPIEKDYAKSSWHLYPIRLKDKYKDKKSIIFNQLSQKGLGVQVHYIPVYFQPYYQNLGYKLGICSNAEDFYQREISLPLYPAMSEADMNYTKDKVIETLSEI